ncbi:Pathogenesis-related thaumatin superfamily protein [Striga hermonthica]|uniref:Pathogenesis-related thaumatin superfamily protein n=1 Tax=Striga hermonthica TaxID=68872 RepID=A0A9N7NF03_STRHE|nr:Pathogenesis-related thaumatin superfamily protein [Striga hermonthica]
MSSMVKFLACFITLVLLSSGNFGVQTCTFYVTNKCPFSIWPATAPNQGHPVLADGGFHLPSGQTKMFRAPGDWSGRIWARTGCTFGLATNPGPACETGDCGNQLECEGLIGNPPATLVEFTIQADKQKPSFYDVSLVDGYNLPVQVSSKGLDPKCTILSCRRDLKVACPRELSVYDRSGDVVACKSACLAFGHDMFCCRNEYGSPDKCGPSAYSKVFKDACPRYVSYAYDSQGTLASCWSDEYVVTFCPGKWGAEFV